MNVLTQIWIDTIRHLARAKWAVVLLVVVLLLDISRHEVRIGILICLEHGDTLPHLANREKCVSSSTLNRITHDLELVVRSHGLSTL